ncbi:TIM barrel protein [Methanothermococcus okinawensis]|uniref:Xylose isomerase domain-containing protein TIM barrel n=1 Tax=Methanothermococcus okinawensis (strain DSM 14208 / JCM 11175 / IH1) TaxID=647113 RepID=F8AN45_METOI|nr:TIM barrel protein [Methanothermococcus okinawensis]AEH06959.1 Xylose isomerase domain-containing protein TIM barrel [Methanothermococcus okinawensis IH1]
MLNFGTAGIPINVKPRTTIGAFDFLKKIGLNAMEIEFVRGVNIKEEKAEELKDYSNDIILSVHAPYYINLNAKEPEKVKSSMDRIINSAKIISIFGKKSKKNKNVVFHPGYYLKQDKNKVYRTMVKNINTILSYLTENKINAMLRPETTGKISQFGNVDELIRLSEELNILPCIDFAHIYARSLGKINDYDSFYKIMENMENTLGKKAINDMHVHLSGIEFGKGGEKNHLPLDNSNFNYKDVLKILKDFNTSGTVICESPRMEYDALILKRVYMEL